MRILLLQLILVTFFPAMGQLQWDWVRHAGANNEQQAKAVATGPGGEVYVTGYISEQQNYFGSLVISSTGRHDFFLAAYDSTGTVLWVQQGRSGEDDEGRAIAVDASGNIYITGSFVDSLRFNGSSVKLSSIGAEDVFTAKFNPSGQLLWARQGGGTSTDIGQAITVSGSRVFITGSYKSTALFGSLSTSVAGSYSAAFITAYDASTGSEKWVRSGGVPGYDDEGTAICSDGMNVFIAGTYQGGSCTFSNMSGSITSTGQVELFLLNYDFNGNGLWLTSSGGNAITKPTAITQSNADLIVAGYFTGTTEVFSPTGSSLTSSATSKEDGFIFRMNKSTGLLQWLKSTKGSDAEFIYTVTCNDLGEIFCGGTFKGTINSNSGGIQASSEDPFILKCGSNGDAEWGLKAGGSQNMEAVTGISERYNALYTCGFFSSQPAQYSGILVNSAGGMDIFCGRVACPTVIEASTTSSVICSGNGTTVSCSGSSGYQWIPPAGVQALNDSTFYVSPATTTTYTINSANPSCYSEVALTITVKPSPVVSGTPISSQICPGGSVTLSASGANSYTWGPASGLSSTNGTSVVANPAVTTTYTVTGAGSNGCTASASLSVTVYAAPAISTSPGNTDLCEGKSLTINANGAASYMWSPSAGLNNTTGSSVTASPSASITYTVTGTSVQGCSAIKTISITLRPRPTLTSAQAEYFICKGEPKIMQVSGADNYTWIPSTGLNNPNNSDVICSSSATQTYSVTGTNIYNCSSTLEIIANVVQKPTATLSGNDTACVNGNATVEIELTGASPWEVALTDGINSYTQTIGSASGPVTISPKISGNYTIISCIDSFGCVSAGNQGTAEIFIEVLDSPDAGNDQEVCGKSIQLVSESGGFWSDKSDLDLLSNDTILDYESSTYGVKQLFRVIRGLQCSSIDTASVTFYETPVAAASEDIITFIPQITLNGTTNTGLISWSTNGSASISSPSLSSTNVESLDKGENIFLMTVRNGVCPESTDTVTVNYIPLHIPTAFTPNGDGINDLFEISGIEEEYIGEIKVFNRWGKIVYGSESYRNNWDGKDAEGKSLPDDSYFYKLSLEGTLQTGYVILKRQ